MVVEAQWDRVNVAPRQVVTNCLRARYRGEHCLCAPADPVLVSLRTLQFWLWQRLQAPLTGGVPA